MAVNLAFIGGAGWQFFDDSGNPLSGGKIYTYFAGTTTPQTTYTSRTGVTANANPIVLDAAGRTPEQIWANEGTLYKYVVTDANNVLIRTWDNIGGSVVASNLAQDLANTSDEAKGDALIGFKQSNSVGFLPGATARTVNDKLQEFISVKDFGAVGDGINDDTAAIQAAVDACNNLGSVFFPAGTYKITDTIDVIYTDLWQAVNLIGVGNGSKIDWQGGNGKPMFYYRGPGTNGSGFYAKTFIEKLYLYGNSFSGDLYSNVIGIQVGDTPQNVFSGVCNFTVRDCLISHVTIGIAIYYESDEFTIENNYIERFTGYGVYNFKGGSGVWVNRNHISDGLDVSVGVYTSLSSGSVEQNIIQGSEIGTGILVAGVGAPFEGKAVSIRNNYLESQLGGDYAIALYGVDTAVIENNTMNGFPGATLILLADDTNGVGCRNVTIGVNRHTQSAGFVTALASASVNSSDCKITGYQRTDGAVTTITGPFQKIYDLNDYSEGTFTAELYFGTAQQTVISTCTYTKIGRVVYVTGTVTMNAAVTGTGSAKISALPYTTSAFTAKLGVITINASKVSNTGVISGLVDVSSTDFSLYSTATSGTRTNLTHANFASDSSLSFSGFYFVD